MSEPLAYLVMGMLAFDLLLAWIAFAGQRSQKNWWKAEWKHVRQQREDAQRERDIAIIERDRAHRELQALHAAARKALAACDLKPEEDDDE